MGRLSIPQHLFLICLLLGVLMVSACSSQRYDPNYWHENFINSLRGKVGQNFDKRWGWGDPGALVNETILPNGNVEYTFKMATSKTPDVTCQYTVEVNSETRIVVATRWTGDDCIIVP